MSQKKFATDLVQKLGMSLTKHVATPLPVHLNLQASNCPLYSDPTHYRSSVGKLNFLTHTHPHISYPIKSLSQYMQNPTKDHYSALLHTITYVAHNLYRGILLQGSDALHLYACSDSDWGACDLDPRWSVTSYIPLFGHM